MNIKNKMSIRLSKRLNVLSSFRKIEKKVVFDSFKGKQYSDNPRAISEKMHELFPDYKIVWGLSAADGKADFIPDYVKVCDITSMQFRKERASAVAYIRNEAMTEDMHKRKGQLYIQTWHGDRGIKKILYDAWKDGKRPTRVMDSELTDLFVLGSDYAEKRIKTAFRYTGRVIKTGCPRNDCLINPVNVDAVKKSIGIDPEKKLLLYAPTLRKKSKVVQATLDIDQTLKHLNERGGEWVCLVRAHPKSLGVHVESDSGIIDVSRYPDMSDLLMIADFLITDYSSCAGDFILTEKPLVLAQFDLEQYMEEDRTFHVDINRTGFLIAKSQDELNALIDQKPDEEFAQNCRSVMSFFGTHETGHSAEDVCRLIDEHYHSLKA